MSEKEPEPEPESRPFCWASQVTSNALLASACAEHDESAVEADCRRDTPLKLISSEHEMYPSNMVVVGVVVPVVVALDVTVEVGLVVGDVVTVVVGVVFSHP